MKSLLTAFQFLTVFPLPVSPAQSYSRSIRYFPIVGVILAAILSCAYAILRIKFSDPTACLGVVVLLIFLTKGLHLDGLSDSFDALLSGRSREDMLAIMKDHHSGALGTAALVCVLLLKVYLLVEIYEYLKIPALFLVLAGSRSGMSLLIGNLPYARGPEGLGYVFHKEVKLLDSLIALGIGLIVASVTFLWIGAAVYFLAIATMWLFGLYAKRKLGGITGDICGAANEIGEIAFLFWLRIFLS